jgi:hypothetical protein
VGVQGGLHAPTPIIIKFINPRLEQNYDVLVGDTYGKDPTLYRADLVGLVILNWSWKDSSAQTRFEPVELAALLGG